MENREKISIVIPIYNVEFYLPRCLDSITAQTYHNIEIILVNDGSPDNSGAVCDDYASRDNRISVFHIPNGGVAKARQLGVESSAGDYIVFVDPDDWLPIDSVELLYTAMTDDIDVVVGSFTSVESDKEKKVEYNLTGVNDYTDYILRNLIMHSPWCKIYRRSLFSKDSFPQYRVSEDWLMNIEVSTRCRGFKTIPNSVYYYLTREGSASRFIPNDILYWVDFITTAKAYLTLNHKYDFYKYAFDAFVITVLLRVRNTAENHISKNSIAKKLLKDITYSKLPSSSIRNKYLKLRFQLYFRFNKYYHSLSIKRK